MSTMLGLVRGLPWRNILSWRPPRLRFDEPDESRFVAQCKAARLRHFVISGAVALVAFNMFLLSDWMMVPDVFDLALKLRLLMLTPVALFYLAMPVLYPRLVRSLPIDVIECIGVLGGIMATACLVTVLLVTNSPYVGMYRCGLLPILVYGTLVQRFRFRYALLFSASVVAGHLISLAAAQGQPSPYPELEVPMFLMLTVIAAYTLIMNYRMELEERRRFVQKERAETLRHELQASQAQLEALSRQDALTGVPNRRRFDEVAATQWTRHLQTGEQLAVLLIDVDHFKAFNDRYGHPAGDQCLKLVAETLQRALPIPEATLARWGGEEFIVLLPHADTVLAAQAAAQLCVAVRMLALRHEDSTSSEVVTISVGVGLARPAQDHKDLARVVAQADAALYQAKRGGRDRYVVGEEPGAASAEGGSAA